MKLTEFFFGKTIADTSQIQYQSAQDSGYFNRQVLSLKPGQTLQGEVIARNGNEVSIKLSDDMVLKARIDQNINLELGKTITFEVKNNGQTVSLMPLYTNTATDANVLKALDMASLPITEETIAMTEQMMKAGLSVDRNSLQQIFKEVSTYPQSNISDIVDLHKMSLPVNEENLAQISSYKNMTHQLVSGLNEVTNTLPDVVQGMIQNGDVEGAAKLYQEILNLISQGEGDALTSDNAGQAYGASGMVDTTASEAIASEAMSSEAIFQENTVAKTVIQESVSGEAVLQNGIVNSNAEAATVQANGDLQLLLELLAARNGETASGAAGEVLVAEQTPEAQTGNLQTPEALASGAVLTGTNNLPGENSGGSGTDITALLGKLLQQGIDTKDTALLQNLLNNKDITAYIKDSLQNMWTIRPQDVADEGEVARLYGRLGKQLRGLTQVLENVNQTGTEAYRATTNLTQNLDFLQQLNQTYTYLQLPLRLQQGNNAHGDLYVYTNKKNLASKEGQITALLHLDMENLGPLDVYVAMQNEKVNTKFYVQDQVLDFLSEHMHILTERLQKRGYDCSCQMLTRETEDGESEAKDVIHRLLEKENHVPLVQYAFDVRT